MKCHKCPAELKPNAKFCTTCGAPAALVDMKPKNQEPIQDPNSGYLNWSLNTGMGEICRRISLVEVQRHQSSKGIIVGIGTKAVFFTAQGEDNVFELESNTYKFSTLKERLEKSKETLAAENAIENAKKKVKDSKKAEVQIGFWKKVVLFFTGKSNKEQMKKSFKHQAQKKTLSKEEDLKKKEEVLRKLQEINGDPFMIYLFREKNIKISFDFENIPVQNFQTNVAMSLTFKIINPILFIGDYMVDSTDGMTNSILSASLKSHVESCLANTLRSFDVETIKYNDELKGLLRETISEKLSEYHLSLELIDLADLTYDNSEINQLIKERSENYLLEKQLDQKIARNQIINLYSTTDNEQEIAADLIDISKETGLWSNEKNRLILAEEKKRFKMLLEKEELLYNAKTEDEIKSAKAELVKTGLLREQDVNLLERKIFEENEDHKTLRSHSLNMIQLNQLIEREDLELEHSIDNRRTELEAELGLSDLQIQIDTKRSDALRDQKRKDADLEMEEQLNRLKLAQEAQALTEKKRQSEHERDLESKKIESQLEIDKLKIQGGMTAEQIMVSNPNISPEAAEAMAKKFEAEAIAKSNDTRAEDAKNQAEQMKDFMESQNKNLVDIVKSVTGAKSESASSDTSSESAKPNHIFCHECAEQIPKEYKFCPHCRTEI